MLLYHYEGFYKFYLSSEEVNVDEEDAKKGIGIPANSTIITPPLEKCNEGEIPVFKNNSWEIVNNYFWRPKVKEFNYDAGRKMNTFQFIEYNMHDFMNFPSIPQLFNGSLVGMRIYQSLLFINKKFDYCLEIYKTIKSDNIIEAQLKAIQTSNPSPYYEFKIELESIVFNMRRILDSLVLLTNLTVDFSLVEKSKKIECSSIGQILYSSKVKNSTIKDIILGNELYEKDSTNFLNIINDLANCFKHTLIHDESFSLIGVDFPTIVGFYAEHNNYNNPNNVIQYHNHNAYHLMMGFQNCIERILRNQKNYMQKNNCYNKYTE